MVTEILLHLEQNLLCMATIKIIEFYDFAKKPSVTKFCMCTAASNIIYLARLASNI